MPVTYKLLQRTLKCATKRSLLSTKMDDTLLRTFSFAHLRNHFLVYYTIDFIVRRSTRKVTDMFYPKGQGVKWSIAFSLGVLLFLATKTGADYPAINVSIVVFGRVAVKGVTSLSVTEPPYEVAYERIKQAYQDRFIIDYLQTRAPPCLSIIPAEVPEECLPWWYYKLKALDHVIIFITPGNVFGTLSCGVNDTSLNLLAADWNALMVNTAAGIEISERSTFSTSLSFTSVAAWQYVDFTQILIAHLKWKSVFLVWDEPSVPVFESLAKGVMKALSQTGSRVASRLHTVNSSTTRFSFGPTLHFFGNISRVMFFYGHATQLRRLLQAREAFQSLLVLQPFNEGRTGSNQLRGQRKVELAREFRRRSLLKYNASYAPGNDLIDILMDGYIAVSLIGQVLNETLSGGQDPSNGRGLADSFLNRTFHTAEFGDVYIDAKGQRKDGRAVAHYNVEQINRLPFLAQHASDSDVLSPLINLTDWPGAPWPPPSEPKCGYRGDSPTCRTTGAAETFSGAVLASIALIGACASLVVRTIKQQRRRESEWWIVDTRNLYMDRGQTSIADGC
ncbi:hypothetical protein BV898_14360 [Hypsibius exemplaris]|uniref:Receptor ligand binding region domain-containing protein n=1 Tax=Hypsibius exemplaris TaxID=2072580 RepID=A0A9X6N9E1_HYPEX|nr:hypothetical protein BV898_14360 [Hypsibius exemplaris]